MYFFASPNIYNYLNTIYKDNDTTITKIIIKNYIFCNWQIVIKIEHD